MRLLRKILQFLYAKKYKCDSTAVLYDSARIVNPLPDSSAIEIGAHSHIRGELLTFGHGGRIILGKYCYVGEHSHIWSASEITIGNRVLISHNVNIFDNLTHPIDAEARHQQFKRIITEGHPKQLDLSEEPVRVEDDAWIGCLSVILKGVTVGKAAVVGAGSVVTSDVPPNTIVSGNPAKIVRTIASDEK